MAAEVLVTCLAEGQCDATSQTPPPPPTHTEQACKGLSPAAAPRPCLVAAIPSACVSACVSLQTEKFYDMLGTGSFAVLALGSLLKSSSMHARKVRQAQRRGWGGGGRQCPRSARGRGGTAVPWFSYTQDGSACVSAKCCVCEEGGGRVGRQCPCLGGGGCPLSSSWAHHVVQALKAHG
jgi:hypothetical protein